MSTVFTMFVIYSLFVSINSNSLVCIFECELFDYFAAYNICCGLFLSARMSTVRRPLPLNLGETRRVPGIILPVEIGPSTQLSNRTDVIINGHKVTIEARDMEVKEELGEIACSVTFYLCILSETVDFNITISFQFIIRLRLDPITWFCVIGIKTL